MNPDFKKWTKREEEKLRKLWPIYTSRQISFIMRKRSICAIKSHADRIGLRKLKPWTQKEDAALRRLYPNNKSRKVAAVLGRTVDMVQNRAWILGIRKSAEHFVRLHKEEGARLTKKGVGHRFERGHIPANKGLRRPGWGPGRMKETQFKKGQHPHTWQPIGSTRFSKEGYLQRKVTDTGYPPRDWQSVHVLLWRKHRGRLRKGQVVVFKDGNKKNIKLKNLERITRRELMKRNSIHRPSYPPELRAVILLTGALKRQIRERSEKLNKERDNGKKQVSRLARHAV